MSGTYHSRGPFPAAGITTLGDTLVLTPEDLITANDAAVAVPAVDIGRTPWQIFWRKFKRDKVALTGIGIILFLVFLAFIAAPFIVKYANHHPPNEIYYGAEFGAIDQEFGTPSGPSTRYWLGVTRGAQDVFSRILYGLRISLIVAFVATGLSLAIGVTMGMIAGYFGGKIDTLISRFMDILLSFPLLLLALGISASCGGIDGCLGGFLRPGFGLVVLIISFANWPYIARIVRGQVLSIREKEFVDAARMMGASDSRIILREVLPNLVAPIIVYATLIIPGNILFEAALSFLGIGIQPPNPSLGEMIADSLGVFREQWWNFAFPGLFLLTIVLAFNLFGDGLRDALEPSRKN